MRVLSQAEHQPARTPSIGRTTVGPYGESPCSSATPLNGGHAIDCYSESGQRVTYRPNRAEERSGVIALNDRFDCRSIPSLSSSGSQDAVFHQTVGDRLKRQPTPPLGHDPMCQVPGQVGPRTKSLASCALSRQRISGALADWPPLVLRSRDDDVGGHLPLRTGVDIQVGKMQRPTVQPRSFHHSLPACSIAEFSPVKRRDMYCRLHG